MDPAPEYDARYLEGIAFFNRAEYFDAHEVWEDLWHECPLAERLFYQSLIQAAVALYHWGNGNRTGARRLFSAGREKMRRYRPVHLGLDVDHFWCAVEAALAGALSDDVAPAAAGPHAVPRIALRPPPTERNDPQPQVPT
jgi:hypothetical protein